MLFIYTRLFIYPRFAWPRRESEELAGQLSNKIRSAARNSEHTNLSPRGHRQLSPTSASSSQKDHAFPGTRIRSNTGREV